MRRAWLSVVVAASILPAACASAPFDRHFDARRWAEAAAAFAGDSALHDHPRALYRAALVHTTPGAGTWDPAQARVLLDRLIAVHAARGSQPSPEARALHSVLVEHERHRDHAAAREATLLAALDSVDAEAERLRADLRWLEARLDDATQEASHLRSTIQRLAADLRSRESELTEIRNELARLKAIDLQRGPVRNP
jgi:hypothetical protein